MRKDKSGRGRAAAGLNGGSAEPCATGGYLTTSQLARRWGVSAVTIIRLIEQGDLGGLKIRGCYRISRRSIENYESRVAF